MLERKTLTLEINGRRQEAEVPANQTLLETLRELGYFEVKTGCEKGDCGACAVLVDGEALDSCLLLTWTVEDLPVTTVAGLEGDAAARPVLDAYVGTGAAQCGYCTPGFVIATESLLRVNPDPSEEEIRIGLSGNLCRCTGYTKIFDAVRQAAAARRAQGGTHERR
ncbi:MAG: 2Fe-2S iron-sulfur cluster binding domain-containing protein [Gammaproteobacteria bacterium]|nr:2Fe-2S iron-sulfur cluster binding domain-containing protein [Gammaproteobacteria bacterium]NIR85595.1 2Fe-2S iron-sulfur cluster binding domain-containing protein [Gammaproteobacteria bacterium]NIR90036.1 2Fe-2S iron-sulfur cluster binding domain-containing protein [Gammaproteobacteria bacterium]NIU06724.1 2Fe-2S iron-sulfur cluster binding domain-containing protein [Gammaproteobacteria bacterium]NIV53655.1 2Fe-2S iron-sulfur cluster binding domain-containing protein [Gammaproteobacteria ba